MPPSPGSLPAVRARLVAAVARGAGGVSMEHALRCVPVRRNPRADDGAIAEWRATFEVGTRQWSASGPDRAAALNALERVVGSVLASHPAGSATQ